MTSVRPLDSSRIPRLRTAWLLLGLLPLLLAATAMAGVTIHCLDVGQGDATLVISSSGRTLLFDGGDNGKGLGTIVPYLASLGIGPVDYMVASHYHADHIGGLDEVYQARGVNEAVYDRGWSYTTATYSSYAATVAPKRHTITDGQVIDLGDGVTATCYAVNGNGVLSPPFDDEENDYCVTLLVECGDFDFVQAGDLSGINNSTYRDIESSVGPELGDLEVYQVNHHGSYTSSNANFLNATHPEVAIISVGNNSYGHPHQQTLDRLVAYGAYVYQTEPGSGGTLPAADLTVVNGHIVISTDGYGEYTVNGDVWSMDEPDLSPVPEAPAFTLLGNHPNPFNPATSISFATVRGGPASLTIYDLTGRRVFDREFVAVVGLQALTWRGTTTAGDPVPSGIYLYRLVTCDGTGSGRMTLVK
jgi:beta-lactamase superfamily II metal-dependent hydrolase